MSGRTSVLIDVMNRLRPVSGTWHSLTKVEVATLIAAADRMGRHDGVCTAAALTLARTMGISQKSVYRGLDGLVRRGILTRQRGGFDKPDLIRVGSLDLILRRAASRSGSPTSHNGKDQTARPTSEWPASPIEVDGGSGLKGSASPTKLSHKLSKKPSSPPQKTDGQEEDLEPASPSRPFGPVPFKASGDFLKALIAIHSKARPNGKPLQSGMIRAAIKKVPGELAFALPNLPAIFGAALAADPDLFLFSDFVAGLAKYAETWQGKASEDFKTGLREIAALARAGGPEELEDHLRTYREGGRATDELARATFFFARARGDSTPAGQRRLLAPGAYPTEAHDCYREARARARIAPEPDLTSYSTALDAAVEAELQQPESTEEGWDAKLARAPLSFPLRSPSRTPKSA